MTSMTFDNSANMIEKTNTLDNFWMPFTANRQFKAKPRLLESAAGIYFTSDDGRQIAKLDFAPTFQMGHPLPFELASRLSEIAPPGLNRIFFTNSGSESADTALKIALAYQRAIGQSSRTRLIGRELGYHGVGFGGISVGGMVNNRRAFPLQLPGVDHLPHTLDIARNAFSTGLPEFGIEKADELERR